MSKTKAPRRKFLGSAAAVGAGTMAFPMVSKAQTVSMYFQSTGRPRTSSTSTPTTSPRRSTPWLAAG